jgi:hypothetical protein
MTFQSPSLSARRGLAVVGSQAVLFTEALHAKGHTFVASASQAGCVIIAEPALSAARGLAMNALAESRSILFTSPNVMAACGRELSALAISQRLFIGTEGALLGHVPVGQWLAGQNNASLTGFFGGTSDAILARMTHRAEDATTAERQLRLARADMDDLSGKHTLTRAQLIHGLWQGYARAPQTTRRSVESVSPDDLARLRRWGMVLRYGFTLTQNTIHVGPTAFAARHVLSGWQGSALTESAEDASSLLLAAPADARTAQVAGLLTDLTSWHHGAISRTVQVQTRSAAKTQQNLYLRSTNARRAEVLAQSTVLAEHPDTSGTWHAIIQTNRPAEVVGDIAAPEDLLLPVIGTPTAESPLRLVA